MNKIVRLLTLVVIIASITSLNSCKKSFDSPPGPSDDINIVANTTIATLKSLHTVLQAYDIVTTDMIISGIVVANDKSGNFYKQLFIEDSTGGIQILLDANSLYGSYPVGRKIFVRCKDLTISDYNKNIVLGIKATVAGLPSVEGIPASAISKYVVGASLNNPVTPTVVTWEELNSSISGNSYLQSRYVNTLVKLEGFEFEEDDLPKTYSDTSIYKSTVNLDIINCIPKKLVVRTSAYSNFAARRVPQGNGSITAVFTIFGSLTSTLAPTKQLIIRDTTDVEFNAIRCNGVIPPTGNELLFENFEAQTANTVFPYVPITISGWNNLPEDGTRPWDAKIFSSNKYAYLSAFGSNASSIKTWLVTKGVNLNGTTTETLSFDTKQDFLLTTSPGGTNVASALKILVSTNYTGTGNPWTTGTWTDITSQATLSPGSTSSPFPSAYTNSGNINLSSYTGTIYVAFRYEGSDPSGTTTDKTSAWEIDNVKIVGN